MNYIKGKVIKNNSNNTFIFETQNIGYELIGQVEENTKQVFIHTIINARTFEKSQYGFNDVATRDMFISLLKIRGLGPISASQLLINNTTSEILEAMKTGNIFKLNSTGLKPSILSLIVPKENINLDSNIALITDTLMKYGFKKERIKASISNVFKPSTKLEKNIQNIIIDINKLEG